MYMRAALLALALGQASALLSSPPNEDKHASALTSPPSDDKHASALTSPPNEDQHASALTSPTNEDKHASALSSPPSDDKFAVLRGLDDAQLMAEVARRNLNACDGAPPQEHRALQEVQYSFKYECSCDPTPEPTPAPSPSPTVSPTTTTTTCDYKHIEFKGWHKTYQECKHICEGCGMQIPCIYDKHTDDALGAAMEKKAHLGLKGGWISLKRGDYNKHEGWSEWHWDDHCKPAIDGYLYCEGHECEERDHLPYGEDAWATKGTWKRKEPNFSGSHVRKSILSGWDYKNYHWIEWDHDGKWADIDGKCTDFGCFCQTICH